MKNIDLKTPVKYGDEKFTNVSLTAYSDGKPAIIVNNDANKGQYEHESVVLSVNIEDTLHDEVALDENNNPFEFVDEVANQLFELGVLDNDTGHFEQSGFVTYRVYKVKVV